MLGCGSSLPPILAPGPQHRAWELWREQGLGTQPLPTLWSRSAQHRAGSSSPCSLSGVPRSVPHRPTSGAGNPSRTAMGKPHAPAPAPTHLAGSWSGTVLQVGHLPVSPLLSGGGYLAGGLLAAAPHLGAPCWDSKLHLAGASLAAVCPILMYTGPRDSCYCCQQSFPSPMHIRTTPPPVPCHPQS